MRNQHLSNYIHENSVLGYRGLLGKKINFTIKTLRLSLTLQKKFNTKTTINWKFCVGFIRTWHHHDRQLRSIKRKSTKNTQRRKMVVLDVVALFSLTFDFTLSRHKRGKFRNLSKLFFVVHESDPS